MWFYIQLRLKSELRLDSESNLKDKIKAVTAVLVEVRQISQRQILPCQLCQLLLVKDSPTTLVFKIYQVSLCGGYWWGLWWLVYAKQFCVILNRFLSCVEVVDGFGSLSWPWYGGMVWCGVEDGMWWKFSPNVNIYTTDLAVSAEYLSSWVNHQHFSTQAKYSTTSFVSQPHKYSLIF